MNEKKTLIHHQFHCLWTKAVGTATYIKKEWMELDAVIQAYFAADDTLKEALDILKFLDEDGVQGKCAYCRHAPCYPDCRVHVLLKKTGRI